MTQHEVVIAGGGPTGLMLAAELMIAGADALVIERRPNQDLDGSRAGGLHARSLEVLDQRGVADRFVAAGTRHPTVGFAGMQLEIGDFPSRHNCTLGLWQKDIEAILADWVLGDLGAAIMRSCEVVSFTQDDDGVDVALSDGSSVRARYLVGCDGGRSLVRKTAGIDFPGFDPSSSYVIAELDMTETPPLGMRPEGGGIGPANPGANDNRYRFALREDRTDQEGEPTFDDVRALLVDKFGSDFGAHNPTWISRFTDTSRQAATYRADRVFVAGDAAHIHGPMGGQGLNVGLQDAVNLGWKLAAVVKGDAPEALLDTYHEERYPVAARVVHNTMAQTALSNTEDRAVALRELTVELLGYDQPRKHIVGMISGLDVAYDLGGTHPLVGRRMPDLDLSTGRAYELLHDARHVFLRLNGADAEVDLPPGTKVIDATYEGEWELPVIGAVAAPRAVLIRPDGHVARAAP